ncbi:MAG: DUF427 domain-containing protein [Pseudomonadota bacterium]
MPRAIWNGTVVAETDKFETVEGNIYFPPTAIKRAYFKPSATKTVCGWKGEASYYTLKVGEQENPDAAWYYPETKPAAENIRGYVAFWKGVTVEP